MLQNSLYLSFCFVFVAKFITCSEYEALQQCPRKRAVEVSGSHFFLEQSKDLFNFNFIPPKEEV